MNDTIDTTVGQMVVERPSRARVFERFGIDYCCGGKKPLSQACRDKGIALSEVRHELESLEAIPTADPTDWSSASLTKLADHIEQTHHAYLRRELPRLEALAAKVARAHGAKRPELLQVHEIFAKFREEMESHMRREDLVLFPACRKLDDATSRPDWCFGSVANPIAVMTAEHDDAGKALEAFGDLTNNYAPPADACGTYRALLSGLAELEADMHQHVHLENNILFPRATAAEARLLG